MCVCAQCIFLIRFSHFEVYHIALVMFCGPSSSTRFDGRPTFIFSCFTVEIKNSNWRPVLDRLVSLCAWRYHCFEVDDDDDELMFTVHSLHLKLPLLPPLLLPQHCFAWPFLFTTKHTSRAFLLLPIMPRCSNSISIFT